MIAGRRDSVTPASAARAAVARMPLGCFELPGERPFPVYVGEAFEKNIGLQLEFLEDVVPG